MRNASKRVCEHIRANALEQILTSIERTSVPFDASPERISRLSADDRHRMVRDLQSRRHSVDALVERLVAVYGELTEEEKQKIEEAKANASKRKEKLLQDLR